MSQGGSKKVTHSLVAMSSAAVLAVYAAGYTRTRSAAERLEAQAAGHRPAPVSPPRVSAPTEEAAAVPASRETPVEPGRVAAAPAHPTDTGAKAAPEPIAPPAEPKEEASPIWGTSRHGDIQAAVVIEGGHIARATISQCLTRYSCSIIEKLPPEVAERQSPEVDYVSGATQSTNAFYYAVVEALGKAK